MSSFVFIDSRVAGIERLIAGLDPDVQVVVLDAEQDGIAQIGDALAGITDLDSIHIISHGSSGTLYLGSTVLTEDNLSDYEDELAQIGAALSEEGDLLLYGCNVGAGANGESFVASLAEYTGADVGASDDATGSTALGGDWDLEILTGAIESQLAVSAVAQDAYVHTLATINGDENANDLSGTLGDDSISGLGGDDTLRGLAGNDTLDGGTGGDSMIGGAGNDRYVIDDSSFDVAVELLGEGTDGIVTDQSISLPDNIENITYNGPDGGGVFGNSLDNVITGNAEDNTMGGNDGIDTVSYAYETINAVTIDLDPFSGFATGSGNDTLFTFENAIGGSAADDITGNDEANVLNGNGGADTLTGGFGGDTYIVDNVGDAVVEASNDLPPAAEGVSAVGSFIDTVVAAVAYSLEDVEFVENLTLSSTATSATGNELNNIITGNGIANTLSGLAGNDTLDGGAGNDTLVGGTGADSMAGGTNDDTYVVDASGDGVTEASSAGTDLIQSSVSIAVLAANVEKLTLTGTSNLSGTGNTLANAINGNTGANRLSGGGGNDTLAGGSGNDTMVGGTGNDTFVVNSTADVVTEASSGGTDLIQSSVTITALAGNVEKLTLMGSADLKGTGNALANAITGNSGANVLKGGSGNDTLAGSGGGDTLAGGVGNDRLTGGTGADKFDFNAALSATTNVDRITDFNVVADQMRLDNDFFTAFTTVNVTLAKGAFHKGAGVTQAHDASDRIIYNTTNGNLYYDVDGQGGTGAKLFATLVNEAAITNNDFFIVT